jgi:hypothetical protein
MDTKRKFRFVGATAVLIFAGVAYAAQRPTVNIGERHGNLRAAQEMIVGAYDKIDQAQADNHDQLGGHAQRAKDYLVQADQELRAAANVANQEGH